MLHAGRRQRESRRIAEGKHRTVALERGTQFRPAQEFEKAAMVASFRPDASARSADDRMAWGSA